MVVNLKSFSSRTIGFIDITLYKFACLLKIVFYLILLCLSTLFCCTCHVLIRFYNTCYICEQLQTVVACYMEIQKNNQALYSPRVSVILPVIRHYSSKTIWWRALEFSKLNQIVYMFLVIPNYLLNFFFVIKLKDLRDLEHFLENSVLKTIFYCFLTATSNFYS